ncbi:MAG TPA: hypothetical protein VFQ43_19460 [Nitrososphaera sp.]|nr:hypothetical protein [Nitrososphaera sp.]
MAETFQTYTYTFLFATAKWIKEQPIPLEFPGYVLYKRISLITFLALTVESYLNHCGVLRFPWWQSAERTLSTHAKLDIILHDSGIALDPGKRPLETIKALLAFRNDIAHGKTQSHDTDHVGFVFGKPAFSRSSWGKKLERIDDEVAFADVQDFAMQVWKAYKLDATHPNPFGLMGKKL